VPSRLGATLLGHRDMRLFLAAQGLDSVAIGVAGRMLLLGAVAAGSALATALAGKAGLRATYLAMASAAAVTAIAVGPLLIRRAAAHSR
jgi:hypothetical protein